LTNKVTEAFGEESYRIHEFSLPLIHFGISGQSSGVDTLPTEWNESFGNVMLLEDSLDLWHITIQNAASMTPQLLNLFPFLLLPLQSETEVLRQALNILNSYILLSPEELFRTHSNIIIQSFHKLFQVTPLPITSFPSSTPIESSYSLTSQATSSIVKILNVILCLFPTESPQHFLSIFQQMIFSVLQDQLDSPIISHFISALSRFLLIQPSFFLSFLTTLVPGQDLRKIYFDKIVDKLDTIAQPLSKKLCAFSLCVLLQSPDEFCISLFPSIINVALSVLYQLENPDEPEDQHELFLFFFFFFFSFFFLFFFF